MNTDRGIPRGFAALHTPAGDTRRWVIRMMKRIVVFSMVLALTGGCSSHRQGAPKILAEAAHSEFGSGAYGCADTIAVAKAAGVDYPAVVDRCLAKDQEAMGVLFDLSKNAGFDAASAQGHAAVLGSLLRRLGDTFFSLCLNAQNPPVRECVRDDLLYDLGVTGGGVKSISDLKKEFPRTFPPSYSKEGFE